MGVANLYNTFTDREGLNLFAFSNADLHARQNVAIFNTRGLSLPFYVLDPIPTKEKGFVNWLQAHQDIHNRTNAILGIAGNDISDVDFENHDQVASWVWLHAQEHLQAATILGLT